MTSHLIENSIPPLYSNWEISQMVGADNVQEIQDKVAQYLNDPDLEKDGNNLYIYSVENGSGKTSCAYYILNKIHQPRIKDGQVALTSIVAVKFANYLKFCYDFDEKANKTQVEIAPFLLLDDVSPWANSDYLARDKREFVLLMMYRREHLLPTIITSNLTPETFEKMYGATVTSKVLENFSYIKIDGGDTRPIIYPGIFEEK